jgi:hypothetical protein
MPKQVEDCVKTLLRQGMTVDQAYAICYAQFNKSKKQKPKR